MDLYQIFPIHTARLTIQILTIHDAFALHTITNHPEITNIVDILATPFTLDDARQLLMNAEQQSHFFLGVYFHHQKELTSVIGIHPQPSQNVEIGYWVSPDYQRQKIAYEALTAILPKLKHHIPIKSLSPNADQKTKHLGIY